MFAVSVFMKSVSTARHEDDMLWEESIVIVDAGDEEEARRIGEQLGRKAECEYETATFDILRWQFACVDSVHEIDSDHICHGTEVFSRFFRAPDARSVLSRTNRI